MSRSERRTAAVRPFKPFIALFAAPRGGYYMHSPSTQAFDRFQVDPHLRQHWREIGFLRHEEQ